MVMCVKYYFLYVWLEPKFYVDADRKVFKINLRNFKLIEISGVQSINAVFFIYF